MKNAFTERTLNIIRKVAKQYERISKLYSSRND